MPRGVRAAASLPACPDHARGRVRRAGRYGLRKRQLYRCTRPTGETHAFSVVADDAVRHFHYPASEIARALVRLGQGASFYTAAQEARERAGRKESSDTNLTVFWLERFAPSILEALLPQPSQLDIVLVDQVPFHVVALDNKGFPKPGGRLAFTVFGAAHQSAVGQPLQVLRLEVSFSPDLRSWRGFLGRVPGAARRIVTDAEPALIQATKARWPRAQLTLCEWHALKRAEDILVKHDLHSRRGRLYPALRKALSSAMAWRRFVRLARETKLPALERWILDVEAVMGPQFRRQPPPRSTGALETKLREVKKDLSLRRGSFEELKRMNLLLGLMTLRLDRLDSEREYARIITGQT